MRSLRVITPAATEPVTLEDAKLHLRVDSTAEDSFIQVLISASRDYCERFTGLALAAQELELTIDSQDQIFLPLAPVASIVSVVKVEEEGETALLEGADYWLNLESMPAEVNLIDLVTLVIMPVQDYQIKIRYLVAPDALPPLVRAAMMLKLGMIYSDRGGENTNDYADEAIDNLLRPYRITFGMA